MERDRINHIGIWLENHFGDKVVKLSLDGGFTCPNRDGTKGNGGCIFCSPDGSGELASDIESQIELLNGKWPKVHKYIAYFQSHTNTYAPPEVLDLKYSRALDYHVAGSEIVGLAVATRPDCLSEPVLDLLSEYNKKTFLWVELGLQTIHKDNINRCYDLSEYDAAVSRLTERGIRVVSHLILGLPGETKDDMKKSVEYVCRPVCENAHIFGIKLHLLNVVKGSAMETMYPDYVPFGSINEYVSLACDMLEIIPYDVTVHRLTGDVPRSMLVSPEWSYKKRTILNGIAHEMKIRNSTQGCRAL